MQALEPLNPRRWDAAPRCMRPVFRVKEVRFRQAGNDEDIKKMDPRADLARA